MSDLETRARAAVDALDPDDGIVGDPRALHNRLRRRRAVRVMASGAAVVLAGVGAFVVTRGNHPLRIGTTGSTINPAGNGNPTAPTAEDSTTSTPSSVAQPPATAPLPEATAAPAVLVATDQGCVRRAIGTQDVVAAATDQARRCFALSDGSIVAERGEPGSSTTVLTRFVTGAAPVDLPLTNPYMLGAGDISGRAVLFVVLPGKEDTAPITVYDVASGSRRTFGFGSGGDSGTYRVSTDGRLVVASENADMGVHARYYNVDGTDALGPDLSGQMRAYPSQDVVHLVLSPDGKLLAYLDGPAYVDGVSDPNEHWALVVVDVDSGHEVRRIVLTTGQDDYTWLDYDGRWAVASRLGCTTGCAARSSVVIDTLAGNPLPAQIPGSVGVATLDAAG